MQEYRVQKNKRFTPATQEVSHGRNVCRRYPGRRAQHAPLPSPRQIKGCLMALILFFFCHWGRYLYKFCRLLTTNTLRVIGWFASALGRTKKCTLLSLNATSPKEIQCKIKSSTPLGIYIFFRSVWCHWKGWGMEWDNIAPSIALIDMSQRTHYHVRCCGVSAPMPDQILICLLFLASGRIPVLLLKLSLTGGTSVL